MKKVMCAILAGVGMFALCKMIGLGGVVPIVILGKALSIGAMLGCLTTWYVFHSMRR